MLAEVVKINLFDYDETSISNAYPCLDKLNHTQSCELLEVQTLCTPSPVNCWKCKHFATSWDPKMPYSCKLLGFKSQVLPSIQVMNSDGRPCFGFDPKPVNAAKT